MALFEEGQRLRRVSDSHRVRDPDAPRNCGADGCDRAIEPGRLAALPFTGRCALCAAAAEIRFNHPQGAM